MGAESSVQICRSVRGLVIDLDIESYLRCSKTFMLLIRNSEESRGNNALISILD